MKKLNKKQLKHCIIENDEYFYRDLEMYRPNMENIEFQVDPTYQKRETTKK